MKNLLFALFMACSVSTQVWADSTSDMQAAVGGEVQTSPTTTSESKFGKLGKKAKSESMDFIDEGVDDITRDIGMSIFEQLTQFTFLEGQILGGNYSAQVYRRLYPNHDINDSYTVIDTFRIPVSIPIWNQSLPFEDLVGVSANLTAGLNTSFEINNIRQAVPDYVSSYPRWSDFSLKKAFLTTFNWKELKEFIHGSYSYSDEEIENLHSQYRNLKNEISEEEYIETSNWKTYFKNYMEDPITKVRFSKLLNLFAAPLKLPLTVKGLRKLHDGEIVTFNTNGYLHLTGSIGWSYSVQGINAPVGGQVSTSTYLNGQYKVSIMKETKRHARVKITRQRSVGINKSFYPLSIKHTFLDGVAVLGVDLDQTFQITPFRYSSGKSKGHAFDVVYRYDLSQKEGRDAYLKAIRGRLVESEQTALDDKDTDEPAVEKIIEKQTRSISKSKSSKFEIIYLFKKTRINSLTLSQSKIHIPSGKDQGIHFVKNGLVDRTKQWSTIFGNKEKKRTVFKVSMDEGRISDGDKDGFGLNIQFFIEDNRTTGKELNQYIDNFHEALAFDGVKNRIFLKVPTHLPKQESRIHARLNKGPAVFRKKAMYGNTNFHMQLQLNWNQIQTFINLDDQKKSEILTRVFGLEDNLLVLQKEMDEDPQEGPNVGFNYYKALKIYKKWKKLKDLKAMDRLHKKLSEFFHDFVKNGYKMVRIIRESLGDDKIAFTINAFNERIGRYSDSGESFATVDNFTNRANDQLSFDAHSGRDHTSKNATIATLESKRQEDGRIEIKVNFNQEPTFIYLQLKNYTLNFTKDRVKFVIANNGRFKKGLNTFFLDLKSDDIILKKLSSILENGSKYVLSMAISTDGQSWGGVKNADFVERGLISDEEIQKQKEEQLEKQKSSEVIEDETSLEDIKEEKLEEAA